MNTGQIVNSKTNKSFTTIPNEIIHRKDLSLKAKGLLLHLLSLPPNWVLHQSELPNHHKDGIDSIRTAFKELQENGYIVSVSIRGDGGTFKGYNHVVYNVPILEKPKPDEPILENPKTDEPILEKPKTDKPILEKPKTDKPKTENPTLLKTNSNKTNSNKTNSTNKDFNKTYYLPKNEFSEDEPDLEEPIKQKKEKEKVTAKKKKKTDPLFQPFRKLFEAEYTRLTGTEYYWSVKDSVAINRLIQKIRYAYKTAKEKPVENPTPEQMENGFAHILRRAAKDKWMSANFETTIIDSKFNNLKNIRNGTSVEKDRELFKGVIEGFITDTD